jgi:ATP-dependent DNA helicase RecG
MNGRSEEYLQGIVRELCNLTNEAEWVEFKRNKAEPKEIGEYISALSNSAALFGKPSVYLVWVIKDDTHEIIGTSFKPKDAKEGNEPLETWLLRLLTPRTHFTFHILRIDEKKVALLEIERAVRTLVAFSGIEYIRVGEVKRKLKEPPFEELIALEQISEGEVLRLLDYPSYFDLAEFPLPENRKAIIEALKNDELIRKNASGSWDITNLGAILFAKQMSTFKRLRRKPLRIIQYKGPDRTHTLKEHVEEKGYAAGFQGLIGYINGLIPANEIITEALRQTIPMFPEIAVRELTANALIHQDFTIKGAGPTVEIFEDRIEMTNPGEPLVDTDRFIDSPPKSRNEVLASLMRRFMIFEERGSGIDKIVHEVEFYQLPAPLFEVPDGFTRTVLFAHEE